MIKWLTTFRIISLILFWIFLFGIFLPTKILAATIPYTVTTGVPEQSTSKGATFLTKDLTIDYQSGQIILSSNPDGTGNTSVDDAAMVWIVERPDGTSASRTFRYDTNCAFITPKPPQDITNLFKPGINHVQVKLYDICGGLVGSSSIYLVNTNAPDIKTPLILIPGIGGSELKVLDDTFWINKDNGHGGTFSYTYAKDEKVWVNDAKATEFGDDDYFDVLKMKYDGIASEAPMGLTGNLVDRAYQGTINYFETNGYKLNQDLFIFPYDWRLDITHTKPLLDAKIQQIKQQTGAQKVDIVAHSMGGLVARYYISDPEKAINIRKLFTLGTPYLGSVDATNKLMNGDCLTPLPVSVKPFCLGIDQIEVRDVLQNMISTYQLIPSNYYFNFYDGSSNNPIPYKYNSNLLNYSQIKALLSSKNYNTLLFVPAEHFHSLDNLLANTNGVDVTVIAGSSEPTLGQIIETTNTNLDGEEITHKDEKVINGDGTVPLFSASINDPSRNLSLLGNAKVYYTNQEHSSLVSTGPALNLVKNILENKSELPENVSTQAFSLPLVYTIFSVHSPVNIHVYDQNGNHTGLTENGDIETNIPGSSYDTLGDAKFVYVPENGVYTVKFEATDQGSFDFKIREFSGNEQTKGVLYKNVPLQPETKGETTVDTNTLEPPALEMDQDGNGEVDKQVTATSALTGNAVNDTTLPSTEISLSGTSGLNNWYTSDVTVTLNAQDKENGSGILKTEYTIDNGQTIHQYLEPFTITQEGITKLRFKSYDKAGNEEEIQELEIKIDKTAPEAKIYVDQDKNDLVVTGIGENPVVVVKDDNLSTKEKNDAIYMLTDVAGNTLKLDVRDIDKTKNDTFKIYSLQYNNLPVQTLENNKFKVEYNGPKKKLNIKEQNFEVKSEMKIRIQYDQKKNQSTIITKEPKQQSVKQAQNGIAILNLTTNKGHILTTY